MPYDELGNFIPGDEPDLDRMSYELSLADTIKQMVKSPANDLSALTKPQTYKDIASGFGSAAESLVRGAAAAPFGGPGDIIQHFKETPLIPGVTDRFSMSDVFPGLDEVIAPERKVAPKAHKQELFGLPYATTADILQAAEKRYTAPFGDKESNDFMESLGMFLSPQMAAGARKGIINMAETTGKMPSLTVDSAQAFARDYANASRGIYPETPTAGSMAADFARQGKKVASNLEDLTVGNYQRAQVRRAAQGVPEESAYDPLRQRREAQAAEAYSVPENATAMYAVKEKGGNWDEQGSFYKLDSLKTPIPTIGKSNFDFYVDNANPEKIAKHLSEMEAVGYSPDQIQTVKNDITINRWIDSKLKNYTRNELATPKDPLRVLADKGVSHIQDLSQEPINPIFWIKEARAKAGFPEQGFAETPLGQNWEYLADQAIDRLTPDRWKADVRPDIKAIAEKDPNAIINVLSGTSYNFKYDHLIDELKNAINPNSDLPSQFKLNADDLDKLSVPNAVERVAKINSWRQKQMKKAAKDSLMDFPVAYDAGDGFKIHELKLPAPSKELPKNFNDKYEIRDWVPANHPQYTYHGIYLKGAPLTSSPEHFGRTLEEAAESFNYSEAKEKLDKALKNEGKQMGHCVGGYTDDVVSGRSRIFTLRDSEGGAHVTIETSNKGLVPREHLELGENLGQEEAEGDQLFRNLEQVLRERGFENAADIAETEAFGNAHESLEIRDAVNAAWPEAERRLEELRPQLQENKFNIDQIKGKGNGPVSDKYRTYVKDWLNQQADNIEKTEDLNNVGLIDLNDVNSLLPELRDMYGEDGTHLYNAAVDANPQGLGRFASRSELRDFIEAKPKKMAEGGRVEPTSPASSVNDQSKPVTPPKRIHNPDAPEFKDMFIRERAIRGGAAPSGGPSADIKQIMNPRNINYNAGGKVSVDQMRYELLRK